MRNKTLEQSCWRAGSKPSSRAGSKRTMWTADKYVKQWSKNKESPTLFYAILPQPMKLKHYFLKNQAKFYNPSP